MGEPWSDIVTHLRGQRLLAPQSLQERLLGLSDPKSVIEAAAAQPLGRHADSEHARRHDRPYWGNVSDTPQPKASVVQQLPEDLAQPLPR